MFTNNERTVNKNRSSLEIAHDMLCIASVKVRKTKIMYRANLGFVQMGKYLMALLRSGLLEQDGDSNYLITEKGKEFLVLYQNYTEQSARLKEEEEKNMAGRLRLENMCFSNKSQRVNCC